MAEDAINGNARFDVTVDGKSVGGPYLVTASHAAGQTQAITINDIARTLGTHDIGISFLDGSDPLADLPSPTLDLTSMQYDGMTVPGGSAIFQTAGTSHFMTPALSNLAA